MFPKQQIEDLIKNGNGELAELASQQTNGKGVISILENLGYLPKDFDGDFLLEYAKSENPKIRLLAIKNLAKMNRVDFLEFFWSAFQSEKVAKPLASFTRLPRRANSHVALARG